MPSSRQSRLTTKSLVNVITVNCKKPGHFARDCFKKKNDQKNESINLVNDDHNADELALKSSVTDINGDEWWIDSGATSLDTK